MHSYNYHSTVTIYVGSPHNAMHSSSMYKNSRASSINTALWHYLGTKHLDFRCENNNTPGVLIEEIRYMLTVYCIASIIDEAINLTI